MYSHDHSASCKLACQHDCCFCVQKGATKVGVSLLYTVKEMDAGPIIAQETVHIDNGIQADELLFHLFAKGTK